MKMVQQQFPSSSSFHLILLILGLLLVGCLAENWQLSGQILCYDPDTEPESHYKGLDDVDVEFWEFDTMDPDDFLNRTKTDIGGFFKVTGEESEFTKTEPYLLVFHSCPDPKMPLEEGCQYQSRFELPPKPEQQFVHIGVGDREFAWSHKAGASQEGSEELAMSKKLKCP